jgi:hypothetical protein
MWVEEVGGDGCGRWVMLFGVAVVVGVDGKERRSCARERALEGTCSRAEAARLLAASTKSPPIRRVGSRQSRTGRTNNSLD